MTAVIVKPGQLTKEAVEGAVGAIVTALGKPTTDLHQQALAAFEQGDHETVKLLAAANLTDHFCKALGYLGGALKLTPNTATILAESARAAAEVTKERTLAELGAAIGRALS